MQKDIRTQGDIDLVDKVQQGSIKTRNCSVTNWWAIRHLPDITLERENLDFAAEEKEETRWPWGFGIFERVFWDYAKFMQESLREEI